jgi:hypothetical protein
MGHQCGCGRLGVGVGVWGQRHKPRTEPWRRSFEPVVPVRVGGNPQAPEELSEAEGGTSMASLIG